MVLFSCVCYFLLIFRRDSFITHRAFCDALAEESARAITTNPLLSSHSQPGSSATHIINQLPITQYNPQDLHAFTLKKEQQSFNLRPEIPPWLAFPGPPQNIDLSSSSSSIFSTRLDHHNHNQEFTQTHQDFSIHETTPNPNPSLGPTLPPYQPSPPSPHMSATALLQKAAQMGATMSNKTNTTEAMMMMRPTHQAHVSAASDSSNNNTTGKFGLNLSSREEMVTATSFANCFAPPFGNKAAGPSAASASRTTGVASGVSVTHPPHSFLHDMVNSLSSATGFEGTSFEDAFGGILNSKKTITTTNNNNSHFTRNDESTSGGGGEGLTRDFLGLRPLSHGDILNIAGLGHCMNTSNEHQNQPQKPWQG